MIILLFFDIKKIKILLIIILEKIKNIYSNEQIYYNISTLPNDSGSPILNLNRNLSVIGILCGWAN